MDRFLEAVLYRWSHAKSGEVALRMVAIETQNPVVDTVRCRAPRLCYHDSRCLEVKRGRDDPSERPSVPCKPEKWVPVRVGELRAASYRLPRQLGLFCRAPRVVDQLFHKESLCQVTDARLELGRHPSVRRHATTAVDRTRPLGLDGRASASAWSGPSARAPFTTEGGWTRLHPRGKPCLPSRLRRRIRHAGDIEQGLGRPDAEDYRRRPTTHRRSGVASGRVVLRRCAGRH